MRSLLVCSVVCFAASACKPSEGGLEAEVKFQGFTPACLDVTATDRLDSSHNDTEQVTVTEARPHRIGVALGKGWSRELSLSIAAREGSCSGKIVASVRDDDILITTGAPQMKTYTLTATDADGDGFVSMASGGTDCNDAERLSAPNLAETCNDGIDNDCQGGADCADANCAAQGCNDGDACTVTDTCTAGTCSGAPLVCGAPTEACRQADAGRCEPGGCFWPLVAVGTDCATGRCNSSGVCVPANTELNCTDGLDDDNDDAGIDCGDIDCNTFGCDAGRCVTGATCQAFACSGAPVVCASPALCRDAGVCNESTGMCDFAPSPAGASCAGDACFTSQSCDGLGSCTGGTVLPCDAGAACQVG